MEKKYWKSQGILLVRKNGNHDLCVDVCVGDDGNPSIHSWHASF